MKPARVATIQMKVNFSMKFIVVVCLCSIEDRSFPVQTKPTTIQMKVPDEYIVLVCLCSIEKSSFSVQTKPKGATIQMKALDEFILMYVHFIAEQQTKPEGAT